MPKIIIDPYDVSSVEDAISKLESYSQELEDKVRKLIEALVARGVTVAKTEVVALGAAYTGNLRNSIMGYYDESTHVGIIRAECDYAIYVEYGTGIVGKYSPHPEPAPGYVPDGMNHGVAGWVYPKEGGFFWTQGQVSHPFMYNTRRELERECASIARGVFNVT